MASGDEELEKIIKVLKSLIVPEKGGLPLHRLERVYREFEGRPIPLAKHGFSSVTALVRSIPEIRLSSDGMLTVQSANLAHLTDLVARQKTSKPKGKKMPRLQTARTGYGARSYSSIPARRPTYLQRGFNTVTYERTFNAPTAPRFAQYKPQPIPVKEYSGKSTQPKPVTYSTQPRQLPTVVYPGKKEQVATNVGGSGDRVNSHPITKPQSVSHRLEAAANSQNTIKPKPAVVETPISPKPYQSTKPESVAHRLVTTALGIRVDKPKTNGSDDGAAEPTTKQILEPTKSRVLRGRATLPASSVQPDITFFDHSSTDHLSTRFAELQVFKARMAAIPPATTPYPSTTPPLAAQPVENAASAHQKEFLTSLRQRTQALASPVESKPVLAAWDPYSSHLSPTSPIPNILSVQLPSKADSVLTLTAWGNNANCISPSSATAPRAASKPLLFGAAQTMEPDTELPPSSAPAFSPAEPIAVRLDLLPDFQPRDSSKPLKPMDRLLRHNLDNTGSERARQVLELQVEQERFRALSLDPTPRTTSASQVSNVRTTVYTTATPGNSSAPSAPAAPHNVMCDWERQSTLMMIKPLYCDAQLIGDNLMMQVAKLQLDLENHFVRAEGVPYRVGLCVSGLTLAQAAVEVAQQRAVYPTLVVCLGTIDILMDCVLQDICRHMCLLLGALVNQSLKVQRVYICSLPPLPTATQIQCSTLMAFNEWLEKFCSESPIFHLCDLFTDFFDSNYQLKDQLYAQTVRINMGSGCILKLRPWNNLGCRTVLDKLRVYLTNQQC